MEATVSASRCLATLLATAEQRARLLRDLAETHEQELTAIRRQHVPGGMDVAGEELAVPAHAGRGSRFSAFGGHRNGGRTSCPPMGDLVSGGCRGLALAAPIPSRGSESDRGPLQEQGSFLLLEDDSSWTPKLIPLWELKSELTKEQQTNIICNVQKPSALRSISDDGRTGDTLMSSTCFRRLVLMPSDPRRIIWDIMSVIVIMWDMLTLPLMVFDFENVAIASILRRFTTVFWAVDLVFTFFVGVHLADGRIDLRFRSIARSYLRSWFALDVVVVGSDIVLEILDTTSDALGIVRVGKAARTVRIMRFFRMLRMARVLKLSRLISELFDFVLSGAFAAALNILKLMFGLAIIVHFIACAWFAVGDNSYEIGRPSWLETLKTAGAEPWEMYLNSYHWTLAQFTPAPSNFHPANLNERLFAILVLYVGLVLFSSLLGNTTALLNDSRRQAALRQKEADCLRKFLSVNQVSLKIGNQILRHARLRTANTVRVLESEVACLESLPTSLRTELRHEVHAPHLGSALFTGLKELFEPAVIDLCNAAMAETKYSKGAEPFQFRQAGVGVYIILSGSFSYYPGIASLYGSLGDELTKTIEPGTVLSESALFVQWQHAGLLTVNSAAVILQVMADAFRLSVQKHSRCLVWLRLYAKTFMLRMLQQWDTMEVDDLWAPFADVDELTEGLLETTAKAVPKDTTSMQSGSSDLTSCFSDEPQEV